jgi:hypothetical protein
MKRQKSQAQRRAELLLIAQILLWLTFFTIGRPFAGIICLILQLTLLRWLPATTRSVYSPSQYNTAKKPLPAC